MFSVAINKYVYIQFNRLQVENCIRVKYTNTEQVDNAEKIQHPLLRESLLRTETEGGTHTDHPTGIAKLSQYEHKS